MVLSTRLSLKEQPLSGRPPAHAILPQSPACLLLISAKFQRDFPLRTLKTCVRTYFGAVQSLQVICPGELSRVFTVRLKSRYQVFGTPPLPGNSGAQEKPLCKRQPVLTHWGLSPALRGCSPLTS